jgi:hypothetical protein
MLCRCAAARPFVLLAATLSCQAGAGDPSEDEQSLEEEPLDFSVDRVDIARGALRLTATMHEGSADVSISLGAGCARRAVGGGTATPSSLIWAFGADELAGALGCDLLVVARATTPTGHVFKVASVPVVAELALSVPEEALSLPGVSRSTSDMYLVFEHVRAREKLSVGDSLIESSSVSASVSSDVQPAARFAFAHRDFARAILSHRPLRLGTSSFEPSVLIGGVVVEAQPPEVHPDTVPSQPEEGEETAIVQ